MVMITTGITEMVDTFMLHVDTAGRPRQMLRSHVLYVSLNVPVIGST